MPNQAGGGGWPDISADLVTVFKTFTFTGLTGFGLQSASPITFFTIGGPNTATNGNAVIVERIGGYTTTDLTGASSTLALGVTGSTSLFIGATTCTTMDADEVWVSTTSSAGGLAMPAATQATLIVDNIIGTIGTADITAGVLQLFVTYRPASPGAYLKAA